MKKEDWPAGLAKLDFFIHFNVLLLPDDLSAVDDVGRPTSVRNKST